VTGDEAGLGPTDEPAAAALRAELRAWLAAHLTDEVVAAARRGVDDDDAFAVLRRWNAVLADAGWAAPAWPVEHGGRAAGLAEQLAYQQTMAEAEAPGPVNVIGVANIAPAIMAFGTDLQRRRFLRPMLRGDEIWCQGMSEPSAGSDLASLATAGRVEGDVVVINGHKTWTSLGWRADWCQLYVRTDPSRPRHRGISCFLVDMRLPGIDVRPLRTMAGDRSFAEVYFTDVVVPRDALLGSLHGGWQVAMHTLGHERAGVATLHLGLARTLGALREAARADGRSPGPLVRQRLAAAYAELATARWTSQRSLDERSGRVVPAAVDGSATKVRWARASQSLAELAVDVTGLAALAFEPAPDDGQTGRWAQLLAASRAASIAGGTTEINLNVVAEHGLGLPR